MTAPTITTVDSGQLDLFSAGNPAGSFRSDCSGPVTVGSGAGNPALDAIRARDEGMERAESASHAPVDRAIIDQAIDWFATTGDEFSANDIREVLPDVSGALIGSRFLAASKRGQIVRVGDTLATHKAGHARRISTWRHT